MAVAWPATVNIKVLKDSLSERLAENAVRQPTDVGPPKVRRRRTAAVRQVPGRLRLTAAQAAKLAQNLVRDEVWIVPANSPTIVPAPPWSWNEFEFRLMNALSGTHRAGQIRRQSREQCGCAGAIATGTSGGNNNLDR